MIKVTLFGRITKDLELKTLQDGKAYCKFSVASDRYTHGEQQADFIDVIVWEKQAENCVKYLGKGRQVVVAGDLQQNRYTTSDGRQVTTYVVKASQVEFSGGEKKPETKPQKDRNIDELQEDISDDGMPF